MRGCTGYRPILDAAKAFACDKDKCPSASEEPADPAAEKGTRVTSCTAQAVQGAAEVKAPSFPEELKTAGLEPLKICGSKVTWYRPTDLASLLLLKQAEPKAKMVAGNTEVGIEMKFKQCEYPVTISTVAVKELHSLRFEDKTLVIGGAVTLSTLEHFLESQELPQRFQAHQGCILMGSLGT
ncbi:unnamed protein product [Effrenium voratum]|uniref:FAD-binding PCMH-type domain-containing protein n=1 Tax=Effrenium voratum TaxID=2562239 RepID=A0AA36ILH9_9DINO|nr:unnamed protein product [Effrenium voratum]CAJ1422988.1 unnamed protein product [Effrenium voratum]